MWEPYPTNRLEDFYPELKFEFQNLPPQLFAYYILQTAVDMAEKGNLLRRWVHVPLEQGVTRYALLSPDGLRIWSINGIFRASCCDYHRVPRFWGMPEGAVCCRPEEAWWEPIQETLVYTGNCGCGALMVNVAVVPERDACELPKIYLDRFYTTLVTGARARIMLITDRPWTNLRVGGELMTQYEHMLAQDAVRVAQRQQRGSVKMYAGKVM